MKVFALLTQITFFALVFMGAKPRIVPKKFLETNESKFLELKFKKELGDKKLAPQKKYLFAILAARELKIMNHSDLALDFYKIAKDIKTDENKNEIHEAFSRKTKTRQGIFYFDVKLETLFKNKQYEKALLALNPEKIMEEEYSQYKIVYDLLNVKIKKRAVKKLFCFDEYQKNPEDYQYSNLLCDLLIEYQKLGKIDPDHFKVVEEYFLKHDLKEIYLLSLAKDIN